MLRAGLIRQEAAGIYAWLPLGLRVLENIERIVREIRTEGTRILMTTHNLGQATRLADDVVFMDAGRVCEHAPVQRFFARPASQAARLYIQGELPWRMAF